MDFNIKLRYHLNLCIYELFLLFIGISLDAGGIYALILSGGARQLIVVIGVKIDELYH